MSIGSEITRIRNAKADIISFLKENGISIPDGISIDDLNYYVEQYMAGRPTPPSNSIFYIFNSAGSVTGARLSTEKVRAYQFYGIDTLRTVTFIYPNIVTSIGTYAFYKCTNLALTELPDALTSIGNYAFQSCTNLTSITFKGTPNSIGTNVFYQCTNLVDIKVPWSSGAVSGAPWGATNATITYDYAPTT